MELPRKKSGDVDWNTLGNILVAYELGEVVCASYVDRVYGIQNPGFEPITDWRFLYSEKDVIVLKKTFEDSPIYCYMGRSTIDLPANVIHSFLYDPANVAHFERLCVESRRVKYLRDEADIKDCIWYNRVESRQCLVKSKRDFVFYTRWEVMNDGKRVISTLSVDDPACPLVPGTIRAQLRPGSGWVLEPYQDDPNRTLVSYLVNVDPMNLPPLITNRVMRRVPLTIHYLKEYLHAHPPTTPSHLTLPPQHTSNRLPELPTSPQIPTPAANPGVYANTLASPSMQSNPLYQSNNMFLSSTQLKTQSQESWRNRGVESEKLLRQVSTVPEEDEGGAPCIGDLSTALSEVENRLDASQGFLAPFEMTTSGRREEKSLDQWLLVQDTLSIEEQNSSKRSEKVKGTPEEFPDTSSKGGE